MMHGSMVYRRKISKGKKKRLHIPHHHQRPSDVFITSELAFTLALNYYSLPTDNNNQFLGLSIAFLDINFSKLNKIIEPYHSSTIFLSLES